MKNGSPSLKITNQGTAYGKIQTSHDVGEEQ